MAEGHGFVLNSRTEHAGRPVLCLGSLVVEAIERAEVH